MPHQYFFYRTKEGLKRLLLENILFMEVQKNYVVFLLTDAKIMVRGTLESIVKTLPWDQFVQTSRFHAVPINRIDTIGKDSLTLLNLPGLELTISRKYYKEVLSRLIILDNAKFKNYPPPAGGG